MGPQMCHTKSNLFWFFTWLALAALAGCSGQPPAASVKRSARPSTAFGSQPSASATGASPGQGSNPATPAPRMARPAGPSGAGRPRAALEATVSLPRPGRYVYLVQPRGGQDQRSFRANVDVSFDGSLVKEVTSDQTEGGNTETQWLAWTSSSVSLLRDQLAISGQTLDCRYDPPVVVLPLPLRSGDQPTQKGSNSSCSWSVQVSVLGPEQTSAAGRAWNAWHVRTTSTHTFGRLTVSSTEEDWIAPELGIQVRSTSTGSVSVGTMSQPEAETSELQSWPGP
jgi:hypothetical protein